MELQVQEDFTGSNDHSPLTKHRRAKRKTPPSPPPPATITVTSTSSTGSGGESYFLIPSTTASSNNTNSTTTKEEDEDMAANCLILLAQGCGQTSQNHKSDNSSSSPYDCKTCNRTFPSFQALGGHRASHKKQPNSVQKSDELIEEKEEETKPKTNNTAMMISSKSFINKVHGCSICGVVFSSGQALGGHMRRHRAAPPSTAARISTSSDEADNKTRKFMGLDLNLPAPFEDDFEFVVASKRRFVLSGPALVDCYY